VHRFRIIVLTKVFDELVNADGVAGLYQNADDQLVHAWPLELIRESTSGSRLMGPL
jgi:hypothetical protein